MFTHYYLVLYLNFDIMYSFKIVIHLAMCLINLPTVSLFPFFLAQIMTFLDIQL